MRKLTIGVFSVLAVMTMTMPAYAQGGTAAAPVNLVPIAAGFGIAIAAGLAGIGQGKVGAAACEAMARNPGARPGIQLAPGWPDHHRRDQQRHSSAEPGGNWHGGSLNAFIPHVHVKLRS